MYRVAPAIAYQLTDWLSIGGSVGVNYANLDFSNTASGEVNGIWNFARRWGVGAGFLQGDDRAISRAFVRFNFGKRE